MRISLEQHGGFAGIAMRRHVDTSTLPVDEVAALEGLVAAADVFERADMSPLQRRGFDMQRYRLEVEDGERRRTLHLEDGSIPDEVKPLVAYLQRFRPTVD